MALSIRVIILIKALFDLAAETHVALVQKVFDNKLALGQARSLGKGSVTLGITPERKELD